MVTTSIVDASTAEYYRSAAAWEAPGLPLQDQLGWVGAWLDDKSAVSPSILQAPDGYYVRYKQEETLCLDHVSTDALREHTGSRVHRKVSGKRTSRQALFRAIGHELDQVRAKSVMLDDLGGDWLLTYQCGAPDRGYQSHKQSVTVDEATQQEILRNAHTRRGEQGRQGAVSRLLGRRSPA